MQVSSLQEAIILLFGLIETELTQSEWPFNVFISFKFSDSHILIVLSALQETKVFPSKLKQTYRI
jgi:hypothetical protein